MCWFERSWFERSWLVRLDHVPRPFGKDGTFAHLLVMYPTHSRLDAELQRASRMLYFDDLLMLLIFVIMYDSTGTTYKGFLLN